MNNKTVMNNYEMHIYTDSGETDLYVDICTWATHTLYQRVKKNTFDAMAIGKSNFCGMESGFLIHWRLTFKWHCVLMQPQKK